MEAMLIAADVWEVVGPVNPNIGYKGAKGVKEKERKMQQARGKIVLELDLSQLAFIAGLEDPREIWNTLEVIHRSASVNSVLALRRRFFRLTKDESESTMLWISRVRARAFELSHTPCPVSDIDTILVITDGLPPGYSTVVSALDALPFQEITMPTVIGRIMGHEAHINRMAEKRDEEHFAAAAMATKKKGKGKEVVCYKCGGKGHIISDCPSPDQEQLFAGAASWEDIFAW